MFAFSSDSVSAVFGVKIGRGKFHCSWDTGATVCLISKQLVREAGLKSQQSEFPCVKKINGISNNSIVSKYANTQKNETKN